MANKKNEDPILKTYKESVKLLKKLETTRGFVASSESVVNYRRVFSRDGVISGLAALTTGNKKLINTFKQTLITLRDTQHETGRIASNVPVRGNQLGYGVSYGTSVGRVDATLWYVLGVCQYILKTGQKGEFKLFKDSIDKALFYLRCLELNGRGFLYIPQGGDWADEYINHGYVLFDEVLYYLAMDSYLQLVEDKKIADKKRTLKKLIQINYFPSADSTNNKYVYDSTLFALSLKEYQPPMPIACFTGHSVHYRVDTFAISLLLLSDILNPKEKEILGTEVLNKCLPKDFPILPAFYPVIEKDDHDWPHLINNYRFKFRNKPHEYHNGGLWPLVHGFFLSSYKNKKSKEYLEDFAKILSRDKYTFAEFYSGKTYKAGGTRNLGFSASAYVLAYNAILKNKKPFK